MSDLGPLSSIASDQAGRLDAVQPNGSTSPQQLQALAQEFESLLLLQVMRQMRQTLASFGDDEGNAVGGDFGAMTDTIDGELARYFSKAGGLGLGRYLEQAIIRQQGATLPVSGGGLASTIAPPVQSEIDRLRAGVPVAAPPVPVSSVIEPQTSASVVNPQTAATTADAAESPVLAYAGAVTSNFGWRRDPIVHSTRFHGGVDIRAAYGQSVPAAGGGRVVFAGEQGGYGLTVVLEHSGGFNTRYAHLSSITVRQGEDVTEGQTIGQAGRSGRATGPHVHLELTRNGQRFDPALIMRTAEFKPGGAPADYSSGSIYYSSGTSPTPGDDDGNTQ